MKRNRNKRSHVSKVRGHLGHYAHARRHHGHGRKLYKRYGRGNHMIIYAEKKKAMIASVVAIAVLIAVKWFAIGYTVGKRLERVHH